MVTNLNELGTGIGGPGMWDPMPLPPPMTPPEPREEEKLIWSKPENISPTPAAAPRKARSKAKKKRPVKKRAAKKKRPAKKRAAKKKKRPVKKRARKKKR